jgi:murein DD-endopeptidase MepM/ murein hydrolase activator NlpD
MRRWSSLVVLVLALIVFSMVVTAQETEPTDPNVTIYVVQRGDNLYRIALQYDLTVSELARVNGIINPANIQVGQRLLIPLLPMPVVEPPQTHTVQPGETLQNISVAYDVSIETLVALNGITNPNALFVGQVLTIRPETTVNADNEIDDTGELPVTVSENDLLETVEFAALPGIIHVIRAGETLFSIAQRYGVPMSEIQNVNEIGDGALIFAGQQLIIPGVQPSTPAADLPEGIASVDITPLVFVEGQTGRVRLTTSTAATVTAAFFGREYQVMTSQNGVQHTLFIGVPLETPQEIYPLTLKINNGPSVTEFALNIQVISGGYGNQFITLPQDKVTLVALPVEENEAGILRSITTPVTATRYIDSPMSLPAAAPMNARFGSKRAYNGGPLDRFHLGADFAGAPGTPVLAAASGRVVMADSLHIRGTTLMIDHGWGIYTGYAHLNERYPQVGEFVEVGDVIGTVGSSGRATGAHLHWEVWVNGVAVDPMQWVYEAFP